MTVPDTSIGAERDVLPDGPTIDVSTGGAGSAVVRSGAPVEIVPDCGAETVDDSDDEICVPVDASVGAGFGVDESLTADRRRGVWEAVVAGVGVSAGAGRRRRRGRQAGGAASCTGAPNRVAHGGRGLEEVDRRVRGCDPRSGCSDERVRVEDDGTLPPHDRGCGVQRCAGGLRRVLHGKRSDRMHLRNAQQRKRRTRDRERDQRSRRSGRCGLAESGEERTRVHEHEHRHADACPPVPDPPKPQCGQPEWLIRGD